MKKTKISDKDRLFEIELNLVHIINKLDRLETYLKASKGTFTYSWPMHVDHSQGLEW